VLSTDTAAPPAETPGAAETVAFTDQADATAVLASPITARDLRPGAPPRLPGRRGYRLGDWVVTRTGGQTPGRAELVPQADFLRRYTPADDAARALLRRLAQTPGYPGPGDPDPGR
jgi:hypothetical protein